MNDKGFNVIAYNRTTSKVDHFLANEAKGTFTPLLIYF
jgi:6-phosphogluconate dehydrogenase